MERGERGTLLCWQAGRSAGCMCNSQHAGLKMQSLVVETAWVEAGFCLGIKNQDVKKRF